MRAPPRIAAIWAKRKPKASRPVHEGTEVPSAVVSQAANGNPEVGQQQRAEQPGEQVEAGRAGAFEGVGGLGEFAVHTLQCTQRHPAGYGGGNGDGECCGN